jgi:DNA/RNA-binding domain of Phe-tRNA-synthetase-like protein
MLTVTATYEWERAHPGAHIGLLEISGLDNTRRPTALDEEKRRVEQRLREKYAGYSRHEFLALPVMAAYESYYKRFDKTYHVQLQLESVVLKGKILPHVSPLVDANFAAELETLVLTAGHDVDCLQPPVIIDVSLPDDEMTQMSGARKRLRPGDMVMRDALGITCTIIYGQDNRSPITEQTSHVLYVAYAPAGVGAADVQAQLATIEGNIRLFASSCSVVQSSIIGV